MYIITFYCTCIIIALLIISLVDFCIKYNNKSPSSNNTILSWLYIVLKGINSFLYLPILYLLCSIFACVNENELPCYDEHRNEFKLRNKINNNVKINLIAPTIICYKGLYYIHFVIGIMFALLFFILNLFLAHTFYIIKMNKTHPLSRISNIVERRHLYVKSLLCVLFCIFGSEHNNWILICFVLISGFGLFYLQTSKCPNNNTVIHKTKIFSYAIFALSSFVLFIGQILKQTAFDGCIGLFFISTPIVFCTVIFTNAHSNKILVNLLNTDDIYCVISEIRTLISLIKTKDTNRRANVLLKGYIFEYELTCPIKMCPLKMYLACKTKKEDNNALLFQHIDIVFNRVKSKYHSNLFIRIIYAVFLCDLLNKKQQAILELNECELNHMSFDEEFQCYRIKKYIEEQTLDTSEQRYKDNNNNGSGNKMKDKIITEYSSMDVASNIAYKKYFNSFKILINKAALLYIDFWTMLLNSSHDSKQLTKLNECGTKITANVEEIKEIFNKIQKVKYNDKETITYYSDFLCNILNDKEHAIQLKKLIKNDNSKQPYDEKNYFNLDLTALASSDEYQYIIISGKQEQLGIIIHISLGVCLLLGYNRNELIGKSYELFMPEMFHKVHKQILINKVSEFKKDSFHYNTNNNENNNYRTIFKDIHSLAKTRAKYLIPILLKIILINTESIGPTFIAKVYKESALNIGRNDRIIKKLTMKAQKVQSNTSMKSNITQQSNTNNQVCIILTNNSFIIQNFTANAISLLGLSSNYINSTIDICACIKQFHEELFKYMINSEVVLSAEDKNVLKREIVLNKFNSPTLIEWKVCERDPYKLKVTKCGSISRESKIPELYEESVVSPMTTKHKKLLSNSLSGLFSPNINNNNNNNNNNGNMMKYYLTVFDAIMGNKQEGYIFRFELPLSTNIKKLTFKNKNVSSTKKLPIPSSQSILNPAHYKNSSKFQTVQNIPKIRPKDTKGNSIMFSVQNIDLYHKNSPTKQILNKPSDNCITREHLLKSDQHLEHVYNLMNKTNQNTSFNTNTNSNSNISFEINKNFIPLDNTSFQFDSDKISYLLNPKNPEDIKNLVKQKAFDKINEGVEFIKFQKSESEEEEENEMEETEEDEEEENSDKKDEQSSNELSGDHVKFQHKKEHKKKLFYSSGGLGGYWNSNLNSFRNPQEASLRASENYYKVNFDKIKFSVYDFKRKMFVERHYEKISQVDLKKRENHHKRQSSVFDDPSLEGDLNDNYKRDNNKPRSSSYLSGNISIINQLDALSLKDKKIILIKQIESSLSKQDSHSELASFQIFGCIFFIIVIGFIIGFAITFTKTKSFLNENFNMIKYSYNLITLTLNSLAHIRELILLSNDRYDAFIINREEDKERLIKELDEFYIQMHSDITSIIVTSLPLEKTKYDSLFTDLIDLTILKDDYTLNIFKMPLTSAFLEVNTAIFHILNDIVKNQYHPLHSYVFFFIDNLNNKLFMELEKVMQMFNNELEINHYKMVYIIIYIECGFLGTLILMILISNYLFNNIFELKASYLEVFLEINKSVIRISLEKCENFTKKLQSDSLSEYISNSADDNSIQNDISIMQANTNSNTNFLKDNNNNKGNIKGGHLHMKGKKRKAENMFLKNSFFMFIIIIFIISFLFVLLYGITLKQVENNILCFSVNKDIEIHYLKLYNYIRDYLFDSNFHVECKQLHDFINIYFKDFYTKISHDEEKITKHLKKTPRDFQTQYFKMYHDNLCIILNKTDDKECLTIASKSTEFGLNVMLANFFEETLVLKAKKKNHIIENNNRFRYNLTLSGTDYEEQYLSTLTEEEVEAYFKGHPLYLYNTDEHKSIKKIYMDYVIGAFEYLNSMMVNSISKNFDEKNLLFLVLWITFGSVVAIIYFSVWLPVQLKLSNVIFKTKNMLRIIPKEVLVNVPTIPVLLGIQRHVITNDNTFNKKT